MQAGAALRGCEVRATHATEVQVSQPSAHSLLLFERPTQAFDNVTSHRPRLHSGVFCGILKQLNAMTDKSPFALQTARATTSSRKALILM